MVGTIRRYARTRASLSFIIGSGRSEYGHCLRVMRTRMDLRDYRLLGGAIYVEIPSQIQGIDRDSGGDCFCFSLLWTRVLRDYTAL